MTMMKTILAVSLSGVLAACGGDDDAGGSNAAIDTNFDYGDPTEASAGQETVLQSALSSIASLGDTPSASAAVTFATITTVTYTLLGAPGTAAAARLIASGPPATSFADEECISVTDTTITFDHCEYSADGITSIIDGTFTVAAGGTLTWDFDSTTSAEISGYSSDIHLHDSGEVTADESTIRGNMLAELSATTTGGGTSFSLELSEALLLDLTYQVDPLCVTDGTLEARRVWTRIPDGYPAAATADRGVLITWTGCNQATVEISI